MMRINRPIRLGFLLIFLTALLFSPGNVSNGQDPGWSLPFRLSDPGQSGVFPEIVADLTGNVHVFWSANLGDYDLVLYKSTSGNASWSEVNDIQALFSGGGDRILTRPSAVISSDGLMHMVYRNHTVFYSSAPVTGATDGSKWQPQIEINNGVGANYFVKLAIDSEGVIHLVFNENRPSSSCQECLRLYYKFSADGGKNWSDPEAVTDLTEGMAKPEMVVDEKDTVHLIWESGRGGDMGGTETNSRIRYASLVKGSQKWTRPVEFTAQASIYGKNPAIGIDGQGKLVAAWLGMDVDVPYFSTSSNSGRTWIAPVAIPNVFGGYSVYAVRTDGYSMATDSSGNVHLVLAGRTREGQADLDLLHLIWDGSDWGDPEVIASYQGDVPEWPRITVGLGNQLHVVWFVRDEENIWNSDNGQYDVWYAQKAIEAPEIQAVDYPSAPEGIEAGTSPTTAPTESSTPQTESSPTPPIVLQITPAAAGNNPLGIGKAVYQEKDYLVLIAKTLIPSVAFLGLVLAAVQLRRRRR